MDTKAPIAILTAAAIAASAGCSQTPAAPATAQTSGRQCFLARDVNGFGAINDELVDVTVGANRYFRLHLSGGCPYLDWSRSLALRTTSGTSWVCSGYDAEIFARDAPIPQHCLVDAVTPISKEQWMATRHR